MWETIKNNILLKTIAVIILGVLGFGLAFNIMFGRNTGMMGEGMTGGYSLESTLAYILMILVKLLLVAIVFIALIAVYKLAKKYLLEGGDGKMVEAYRNDPLVKAVLVIVATVLVIALVAMLFNNILGGYGMMPNNNYTMGAVSGFGLTSALILLVKLLMAVSVAGLAASIIFYIIQNPSRCTLYKVFSATSKSVSKLTCTKCGADLKQDWKCCPNCGDEMDGFRESEVNPISEEVDETERKKDVSISIDTNDRVDIYEKLYDSASKDTTDNNRRIAKKKQNKR